ncbi:cytochrome P450 [Panicum miliaceum]|uniref:Cytochrome P450 n=1 Tax=Panicum miliaceum TaxID=4540 RepID=A0A3L6RWQ8_PANMI|nr:cytochrome P450 [Panicum miliaceum]
MCKSISASTPTRRISLPSLPRCIHLSHLSPARRRRSWSTTSAVVRGYEIPDRTAFFVNTWAIGRDPAAWDASEEFGPERIVGGGLAAYFTGQTISPSRLDLLGINFALLVLELVLSSLLRHFDWELPVGTRPTDLDMGEGRGRRRRRGFHLS